MKKLNPNNVNFKTGSGSVILSPWDKIHLQAEAPTIIGVFPITVDPDTGEMEPSAEPIDNYQVVPGTDFRLNARQSNVELRVAPLMETGHWWFDVWEHVKALEPNDPQPVEIPEEALVPESLENKLKRMLGVMVEERYGRNSQEYDTFEEADDFDIDPDYEPLSGYEVAYFEEEVPVDTPDETPADDSADPPDPDTTTA